MFWHKIYTFLYKTLKTALLTCIIFISLLLIFTPGFFILERNTITSSNKTEKNQKELITYYINLDRSQQRRQEIKSEINGLNTDKKRVSGVDLKTLPNHLIAPIVDFDNLNMYTFKAPDNSVHKGIIGCILSHKKVWREFMNSQYKYALILEDDASFNYKTLNKIIKELPRHSEKWDIVKLSYEGKPIGINIFKIENFNFLIPLAHTDSAAAYIINKKAAKTLLEYSLKYQTPPDYYIERNWELGLKLIMANPNIVHQRYNHTNESTIGSSQKVYGEKSDHSKFYIDHIEPIVSNMFNIKRTFAMFFHGIYMYIKHHKI